MHENQVYLEPKKRIPNDFYERFVGFFQSTRRVIGNISQAERH
jgi:hypothetical protein